MKLNYLVLLAVGVSLVALPASWASPGRNASMTRHTCRDLVNAKGLKGGAWTAEFEKCKMDVINYK